MTIAGLNLPGALYIIEPMLKNLTKLSLLAVAVIVLAIGFVGANRAHAQDSEDLVPIPKTIQKPCAEGSELDAATGLCKNTEGTRLTSLITFVANLVFGIVGTVTVIMIIVAGIQLSASSGSPDAIKSAKNKLIAAITSLILLIAMAAIFNLIGFQVS